MPKELFVFLSAFVGASVAGLATYIAARITGKNQIKIAQIGANKDVLLQQDKLLDARIKSEVSLEREKLEKLHLILSAIELENSQTMSYIQSNSDMALNEYRSRYLENCTRLHQAQAISDVYYPEMRDSLKEVYGQSNIFWGAQEGVLRTDVKENNEIWSNHVDKALQAGTKIGKNVRELQYQITQRSKELRRELHQLNQ